MSKSKIIVASVVSIILEVGILCLGQIASLAQRYKIPNLNKDMVVSSLESLGHHPIIAISNLIKVRNLVFILGTCLVLIVFLRLLLKTNKKKYEIESEYAIHGSSRYANNKEIFVEGETVAVPVKQFYEDLIAEIKGENR